MASMHTNACPEQLSERLFRYNPTSASGAHSQAPTAVVLYGWMDAELKYVAKYADMYAKLLPSATVLVNLTTNKSTFLSSELERAKEASYTIRALRDVSAENRGPGRATVLFHSFSNGGIISLSALLRSVRNTEQGSLPEPVATVMDCCPGALSASLFGDAGTFAMDDSTIASRVRKMLISTMLTNMYRLRMAKERLAGRSDDFTAVKAQLNNPALWAWAPKGGVVPSTLPARLYLYSRADRFIPTEEVETSAKASQDTNHDACLPKIAVEREEAQWPSLEEARTRLCMWDNAPHCALLRYDPQRYVAALGTFLQDVEKTTHKTRSKL
ncbi:hypothetical protein MVES1_003051 [Malassezia vespertilionis]|uniref:Uncharacterized protein n=1 Tax=Malassezia vespertilionis TaxID=2020962 RepID=A0A2N1J9K7_9BASI|nr:uncharacterized protein MVES1_003051 [Malassezia vespertilionis]PKI83240.1 hypothetical protein MVES_002893 [Malassezia vespertilionis]WFD07682.1 hypothetical protein MVES1_003051 [Malassezia vespertilionis]